jgi:hypothetical protein
MKMFRLGKIKTAADSFLNQYKSSSPASYAAAEQAVGGLLIVDGFIGIDNPLGGNKRSGIFGSLIGVILGLLFVFGTGFISNMMGINKLTATTTATVVSVNQSTVKDTDGNSSQSCTARARYTVGGKDYTQNAIGGSSSSCSLTPGQTIQINYDPNNPGAWGYDINTVKTVLKLFPLVGAIVAITSLFTFVIRLLSIIFGWKLLKSGRAQAKTLPAGTDISTMINEIRQNFAQHLFGLGSNTFQPKASTQNPTAPIAPMPIQAQQNAALPPQEQQPPTFQK